MPYTARIADRFVAHIDILGMSQVALSNPQRAFDAVSSLSDVKDRVMSWTIEIVSTGQLIRDQIEHIVFSDTVIFVTKGDTQLDTYAVMLLSTELFYQSLNLGIPIRAGIAHGKFFDDPKRKLFVGPPLVNAYQLGENAQWLGIVLDSETAERARAIPLQSDRRKPLVVDYDVPVKSGGRQRHPVADWVEPHRTHFKVPLPLSGRELYKGFAELSGPYDALSLEVRMKYQNTADFISLPRPD